MVHRPSIMEYKVEAIHRMVVGNSSLQCYEGLDGGPGIHYLFKI